MLSKRALLSLRAILPPEQVFIDKATLISYEVDAGLDKGAPDAVVLPRSAEEVARIVSWAAEYQIPLIARGAGTGLSGGAVADRGGVIVEFVHMKRLLAMDGQGRSMRVEPAFINLHLADRVKAEGLYFPPDPSSQRASTIGGNVAENSGGPHCFKYGVTTNYISAMRVVLADGSSVQLGGRALDYPEYDLCGLLTGSEGLLGLITEVTLRLLRNSPGVETLLAVFDSVEHAGDAVSAVIAAGLVPATMEMMDQKIVTIIEPFAHAQLPLDAGAVLIIEVDGYPTSLGAQMNEVIGILKQHGGYNMRMARDEDERARIWLARKSAAGAIAREAPAYMTVDVTVPRSRLTEMLAYVNQICERHSLRASHVFHAGDGNLHPLILIPDPDDPELMQRVHTATLEMVKRCVEMDGSLTGEHGVGIEKRHYMTLMHRPAELMAMWDIKHVFDPQSLFNPGKLLPLPAPADPYPPAESSTLFASLSPASVHVSATVREASQILAALTRTRQAVSITGAPAASCNSSAAYQQISTGAMNQIQKYAPEDLYITVGAGTPLADVRAFLEQRGMQLPLVSPWPATTIGGLVATNLNAPLRMRYGAVRDLVLCATVVLPDGRIIRTGRPLVKNVAGFDMTKIFIGSHGTLGLLADVSLKISALPRARRSLLIPVEDVRQGLSWGQELRRLALTASALVLCKGYQRADLVPSPYLLVYTAEGMAEDVQAEFDQVRQALQALSAPVPVESDTLTGTDIWAAMAGNSVPDSVLLRIGLPGSVLPAYVRNQQDQLERGDYLLDIANGFVYARCQFDTPDAARTWIEALRQPALASEGYAVLLDQPSAWQGMFDPWGYQPECLPLMQRLRSRWDPSAVLQSQIFAPIDPL